MSYCRTRVRKYTLRKPGKNCESEFDKTKTMKKKLTSWQKFVKKHYRSIANGSKHRTIMKHLSKMYKMQSNKRRTIRQREPTLDRPTPSMPSNSEVVWKNSREGYHNVGSPAILRFYLSGRVEEEQWFLNDVLQRPGGLPVIVNYTDVEGSPVYSETFKFEIEYEDDDNGEISYADYYYIRLYFDEDMNPLNQPEERFEDEDGAEISKEDFVNYVSEAFGEEWMSTLVFSSEVPRDSIPELAARKLSWKNNSGQNDNRQGPAVLTFFNSGRLRSEEWYVNGVYQREGNLPYYVSYRDNSSNLTDRVETEIWAFVPPNSSDVYGTIARSYTNLGEIERSIYSTSDHQIMSREEWERIYGTPTLISTITSQNTQVSPLQTASVPICPKEDINRIREPKQKKEIAKCATIFSVDAKVKNGLLSIGRILNKFIDECNIMEDEEIDQMYLATTVKYLQKKLPLKTSTNITTSTNKEIMSAIPYRNALASYIRQASSSTSDFKVRYSDQPGIDYGGVSRQFFSSIIEKISSVLFSEITMESEPYVEIYEQMTEAQKKKAELKAGTPRYYITKKTDKDIRDELNLDAKQKITEVYELAGAMFAYAAINQIPFSIPLSRILLKKMLQEEDSETKIITINEAVATYILDTGKVLSKTLVLDYNGTPLEELGMSLEELENSLLDVAKNMYKINGRLFSFIKGFSPCSDLLREKNITPNELHELIHKSEITQEEMKEFLNNVEFKDFESTQQIDKVKETILNIGDYLQLLRWWTGTPAIIKNKGYKVSLKTNVDVALHAHTCSFEFDINRNIIEDTNLLDILEKEIHDVKTNVV